MPPKKDSEVTLEQLQQQMSRISLIEQEVTRLGPLEQSLSVMQQQIAVMYGSWERDQKEKNDAILKAREREKGKAHQTEGSTSDPTTGSKVDFDGERRNTMTPSPFQVYDEGFYCRGFRGHGAGPYEEQRPWRTRS